MLRSLPPGVEYVGGRAWLQSALGVARMGVLWRERPQLRMGEASAMEAWCSEGP